MKLRLSHRWSIALISAAAAAVLFSVLLFGAFKAMSQSEFDTATGFLTGPLKQTRAAVEKGLRGPDLESAIPLRGRVSIAVFGPNSQLLYKSGPSPVGPWQGVGRVRADGRYLVYKSAVVGPNLIVVDSDWTDASNRLAGVRLLFTILLLPLAAIVGLTAYLAAGLMYGPLKLLTGQAKEMASTTKIGRLRDPHDPDFSPLALELNTLLDRIESEMKRQEQLVADVAHDLRTPLTIIRGRLETALLRGDEREYRAAIEIAVREAERLTAMANAILRSDVTTEEAAPIELSRLASDVVDRWKPAFQAEGAQLTAGLAPCQATIQPSEWTSLLENLIDNALKYGGNACCVRLSVAKTVVLEVADNGPGVPDGEQKRIFERFVRLDRSRASEGYGLGLFLCAQVVSARGGAIRMESDSSSGGSKVVVTLPLADV
ncbi:MAG: two-component system, OmpR family, sensor kinase [Fimbriimonadaceae bacterium]|jgi:signal transduction histidine kinase|nr:two-component system, OmpR family, sensor kinase [Fimbriimonadaceae bacterium]